MRALAHPFRVLILLIALGLAALALYHYRAVPPPELPPLTGEVDRIVIEKAARRMTVYRNGAARRSYWIALGFAPEGAKQREGDGRTPEGLFRIDRRNEASAFHLSLGLNYPRPEDRARALVAGTSPGGDIFIHGQPNGFAGLATLRRDWTAGCIAVADLEIEELWRVVPIGTEVEIRP